MLRVLLWHPAHSRTRLLLRKVERRERPPGWDAANDCDVVFRGRKVGRIHLDPIPGATHVP